MEHDEEYYKELLYKVYGDDKVAMQMIKGMFSCNLSYYEIYQTLQSFY